MNKLAYGILLFGLAAAGAAADDHEHDVAMFGGTPNRNMVDMSAKGLATKFDTETGENIKWSAALGSQTYAGPIVADGMVFVGTNNERLYNEKLKGDRGNIMAFDAETGEFLWQSAHAKLGAGRVNDWPLQGVCSTPAIQEGAVWYMSNRAEVIKADIDGFRDGTNDGWAEEEHTSEIDEDIIWKYDLIGELDAFPHNLAAGSPLIVGDIVYAITGQGVDEGHINIPSPEGPSFVALHKDTGELIWESSLPGDEILHGSWSNPSYAEINGKKQVLFPGGDGWLYSFEPKTGKLIWKFNLNPKGSKWVLGGRGTKNNVISMAVIVDGIVYIAVGQDPEHGEGHGNLWALRPNGTGDLTDNPGVVVWHRGGEDFHRTMSTASIADGLMYIADLNGFVYALDAKTGKHHWTYDTFAAIWGSTFVADGHVFIGDEDGDLAILKHGTKKELVFEGNLGSAVYTTPVVKDGVMYIASRTRLYAIEDGIPAKPKAAPAAKSGE